MAATNPRSASRRLLEAAVAERAALEEGLRSLEGRRAALQSELRSLEIEEREMRRRLQLVDELAGSHKPRGLRAVPELPAGATRTVLRGAQIRRVAVQLVAACSDPLRPRHYTEWFDDLIHAGFAIAGRDPLASFLTQLARSPVVRREPEPGVYRLHYEVVGELERELVKLNEELARLHQGQQTIEAITSVQEERERITREVDRLARTLAEATAALHPR